MQPDRLEACPTIKHCHFEVPVEPASRFSAVKQTSARWSFQPAIFSRPLQDLLRQCSRLGGAFREDAVDVIQIGREFGALLSGVGEIVPVILEQRLLQIAVAEAAGAKLVLE